MISKIKGVSELRATFLTVGADMQKKVSLRMVASAGSVVKKEAKRIAQSLGLVKTGAMIKNIAIKRDKSPDGVTTYNIGVRHGRSLRSKKAKKYLAVGRSGRIVLRRENDPFYWRFLEFGRKIVGRDTGQDGGGVTTYTQKLVNGKIVQRTKKYKYSSLTGRRRLSSDRVEPTPFIGPALKNKQSESIDAMGNQLLKEIEKLNK